MKKNEKRKVVDKTRNDNIAAALAYLRSMSKKPLTNGKLAEQIGIDEDTITNIVNYYSRPSDATVNKLYVNTGKIFNLLFLLGQSSVMLAENLDKENLEQQKDEQKSITTTLSVKDEMITNLYSHLDEKKREIDFMRSQLVGKDETINFMQSQLAGKDKIIDNLLQQIDELRMQVTAEKGLHSAGISYSEAADPTPRPRKNA